MSSHASGSMDLRQRCWPDVADKDWANWRWQLANRVQSVEHLASLISVTAAEIDMYRTAGAAFPIGITPYYASLMDPEDPQDPIRLQAVPTAAELDSSTDEQEDPLAEEAYMPVAGLTHRYPDRALLYTTHHCAVYCRHCNRRRKVGDPSSAPSRQQLQGAIDYIRKTTAIRDVLVSGGDPLSLSDDKLGQLLAELRTIEHLDIIRLATRNPVTLPQRITPGLVDVLKQHHPIYISTHFNHLKECTPEAAQALEMLADAGCVVGNQMVLLKGVNEDPLMVRRMNQWLLKHRCRPYYIFQCDSVEGAGHFKTPIETGVTMIDKLRGWTSGMAVPHYVVDLPNGGGKVPVQPNYLVSEKDKTYRFRNYAGELYEYVEG